MSYDGRSKYDAEVAATYDRDRMHEPHWVAEIGWVERFSASHELGTVLDVPIGTGRLLPSLVGARFVVGIDVSTNMLDMARAAIAGGEPSRIGLIMGDATDMGFPDGRFDTVLCFRLVHLLPPDQVERLLREFARVARGTVLLQVYEAPAQAPTRPFGALLRRLERLLRPPAAPPPTPWSHIQSFPHSREHIDRFVRSAGFEVLDRHHLGTYDGSNVEILELVR